MVSPVGARTSRPNTPPAPSSAGFDAKIEQFSRNVAGLSLSSQPSLNRRPSDSNLQQLHAYEGIKEQVEYEAYSFAEQLEGDLIKDYEKLQEDQRRFETDQKIRDTELADLQDLKVRNEGLLKDREQRIAFDQKKREKVKERAISRENTIAALEQDIMRRAEFEEHLKGNINTLQREIGVLHRHIGKEKDRADSAGRLVNSYKESYTKTNEVIRQLQQINISLDQEVKDLVSQFNLRLKSDYREKVQPHKDEVERLKAEVAALENKNTDKGKEIVRSMNRRDRDDVAAHTGAFINHNAEITMQVNQRLMRKNKELVAERDNAISANQENQAEVVRLKGLLENLLKKLGMNPDEVLGKS